MTKLYICGDSFAVPDPEYGPCWVDYLEKKLPIVNLAQVCASNLLISKQVDTAIANKANFIICLATSSTRFVFKNNQTMFPYSILGVDTFKQFNPTQKTILKNYLVEFFNLEIAIYENKCIIENTLQKLTDSGIPFMFDQGGFEHVSYGKVGTKYFEKYERYRSKLNLWDYALERNYRPYYHITNTNVHKQIAEYYLNAITT